MKNQLNSRNMLSEWSIYPWFNFMTTTVHNRQQQLKTCRFRITCVLMPLNDKWKLVCIYRDQYLVLPHLNQVYDDVAVIWLLKVAVLSQELWFVTKIGKSFSSIRVLRDKVHLWAAMHLVDRKFNVSSVTFGWAPSSAVIVFIQNLNDVFLK